MTHPPCGRPLLFVSAAVAVIALFLGLAAGPASAGPDVSARAPSGKSGDPGPKSDRDGGPKKSSDNGGDAKKKSGEGAKPGSPGRSGKSPANRPHEAKGPASPGGAQHNGGQKASSASDHEESDSDEHAPAGGPHQDEPVATPTTSAQAVPATTAPPTTTTPLRDPDHDIRTLSSGTAGISTSLASDVANPAGSAPPAGPAADAPPPPTTVVGGALDPPLLGAGPEPSRWAPFVPALDEPAFPAFLLAALALFLALFGRGDRRDPKLVEAVVDDRTQEVDFS